MEQIIMYIITTIIGLVIGYFVKYLSNSNKKNNALYGAIRNILKSNLVNLYYQYEKIGCIPARIKEAWYSMYESYIALDGNSFVKSDIKPKMDKLPTCEEVE